MFDVFDPKLWWFTAGGRLQCEFPLHLFRARPPGPIHLPQLSAGANPLKLLFSAGSFFVFSEIFSGGVLF